ncbi:phosphonate ABC transporter, permease protein PhnE, partial [Salmonella enterica subsp. enterica]|nr:phosphonate ABC transporter, permease protein PhnE [Salmonella enterica subsp. enterica]
MSAITADTIADFETRYPAVFNPPFWRRFMPVLIAAGIVAYVFYCWWFFSIGTVLAGGQWQRAELYARDWVSYAIKTTVRPGPTDTTVSYPRFSELGDNPNPSWVVKDGNNVAILFGSDKKLDINDQRVIVTRGGETLTVLLAADGAKPQGPLPGWATLKED